MVIKRVSPTRHPTMPECVLPARIYVCQCQVYMRCILLNVPVLLRHRVIGTLVRVVFGQLLAFEFE